MYRSILALDSVVTVVQVEFSRVKLYVFSTPLLIHVFLEGVTDEVVGDDHVAQFRDVRVET